MLHWPKCFFHVLCSARVPRFSYYFNHVKPFHLELPEFLFVLTIWPVLFVKLHKLGQASVPSACLWYDSQSFKTIVYFYLSFTAKEDDKLFWDENMGHIKTSCEPGQTKYTRVRNISLISPKCNGIERWWYHFSYIYCKTYKHASASPYGLSWLWTQLHSSDGEAIVIII